MSGQYFQARERVRIGGAFGLSLLIHAVVFVVWGMQYVKFQRVTPGRMPLQLVGEIVTQPQIVQEPQRGITPDVPVEDPAPRTPLVTEQPQPVLRPSLPVNVTAPSSPPPAMQGKSENAASSRGITVEETLFQRAYPRGFDEVAKGFPDFVRSSDLEQRPDPIELVLPQYPAAALSRMVSGRVTVAFFIDETGRVVKVAPVVSDEGFTRFRDEVVEAMEQSRFTPGRLGGRAVKSIVFHELWFDPRQAAAAKAGP